MSSRNIVPHKTESGKDEASLDLLHRRVVKKVITTAEAHDRALANLKEDYAEKEGESLNIHRTNLAGVNEAYDEEKNTANKVFEEKLTNLEAEKDQEITKVESEFAQLKRKTRAILTSSSTEIEKASCALKKAGLKHLIAALDHRMHLPEVDSPHINNPKHSPPPVGGGRRGFVDVTDTRDLRSAVCHKPRLSDNFNNPIRDDILRGRDAFKNVGNRKSDKKGRQAN